MTADSDFPPESRAGNSSYFAPIIFPPAILTGSERKRSRPSPAAAPKPPPAAPPQDRNSLKHAIENEESPLEWAARMIQTGQRSEEEQELLPLPALEPGAAHLAAAILYQQRNIAEGKCQNCPEPLDRNSVRFCSKHLAMARNNARTKKGLTSDPGSRDYLYTGDIPESTHGRQPGTLKSLAMNREKATRALLADAGIPPASAAVTKRAAKEALMERMPKSKDEAKSASELFLGLPTSDSLAKKALAELFAEGKIQRFGKGTSGEPFSYFASNRH